MQFNTMLLHGKAVTHYPDGATLPPLVHANAFRYDSAEILENVFAHKAMGFAYTRVGNPTVAAFAARVNEMEGGAGTIATASGMAALLTTFLSVLTPGDELIAQSCLYGGTLELFADLEKLGIHTRFAAELSPQTLEPLICDRTRLIFGETISNPALRVMDISAVADIAHTHGIPLIVDSTTTTPYLVRPLSLGADIVIHSSSKYIAGSGNAISGVIVDGCKFSWDMDRYPALKGFEKWGKLAFQTRLRGDTLENFGGCLSPDNAFLNILGLETLGLRMDRICANADALARALSDMGGVEVNYPLLPDNPTRTLCEKQFNGRGGGILTFRAGSRERAFAILNRLRYAAIASNIGDVRTLAIHPASTLFRKNPPEQRHAAGVFDDTIRVSVGIEDIDDLIEDFTAAIRDA